jgi:hypothetical protein
MKLKLRRNVTAGSMGGSTACSMSCTRPLVMILFLADLPTAIEATLSAKLYKAHAFGAQ